MEKHLNDNQILIKVTQSLLVEPLKTSGVLDPFLRKLTI